MSSDTFPLAHDAASASNFNESYTPTSMHTADGSGGNALSSPPTLCDDDQCKDILTHEKSTNASERANATRDLNKPNTASIYTDSLTSSDIVTHTSEHFGMPLIENHRKKPDAQRQASGTYDHLYRNLQASFASTPAQLRSIHARYAKYSASRLLALTEVLIFVAIQSVIYMCLASTAGSLKTVQHFFPLHSPGYKALTIDDDANFSRRIHKRRLVTVLQFLIAFLGIIAFAFVLSSPETTRPSMGYAHNDCFGA